MYETNLVLYNLLRKCNFNSIRVFTCYLHALKDDLLNHLLYHWGCIICIINGIYLWTVYPDLGLVMKYLTPFLEIHDGIRVRTIACLETSLQVVKSNSLKKTPECTWFVQCRITSSGSGEMSSITIRGGGRGYRDSVGHGDRGGVGYGDGSCHEICALIRHRVSASNKSVNPE